MKLKEKLILSGIIITAGTVFSLFFTAAIHGLLSRQYEALTLIPFFKCVEGLFTQKQQLMLFLSFEGFIALCCMLFFVPNNRPYQSHLVNVTDNIQTPAPVGQFQHGSARWLKEKEKAKAFDLFTLDPSNEVIKELISTGYDNLDFLKEDTQNTPDTVETEAAGAHTESDPPPVSIKANPKEVRDDSFESVENPLAAAALKEAAPHKEPAATEPPPEPAPPKRDRYKLMKSGGIVVGMTKEGSREQIYYLPCCRIKFDDAI